MKPTSEIAVSKIQRGEKMYCKGFADLSMNRLMFYHCEYARQQKKIITLAGVIIVLSDDQYLLLQIRQIFKMSKPGNDNS